MKIDTSRGGT